MCMSCMPLHYPMGGGRVAHCCIRYNILQWTELTARLHVIVQGCLQREKHKKETNYTYMFESKAQFDGSRRRKKGLKSSRDKNDGTNRSEGGGEPSRSHYVTPGQSYDWEGREREGRGEYYELQLIKNGKSVRRGMAVERQQLHRLFCGISGIATTTAVHAHPSLYSMMAWHCISNSAYCDNNVVHLQRTYDMWPHIYLVSLYFGGP